MSYDFSIEVDTGGPEPLDVEPHFDDALPAFIDDESGDGMAGTVMLTTTGYARCGNYTSNVSGMWAKCLTAAMEEVPEARRWAGNDDRYIRENWPAQADREVRTDRLCLRDLHGQPCGEIATVLRAAVDWGIANIAHLREQNPDNGWGNAEGAITYLWDIQRSCEMHPAGKLRISS